MNVVSLLIAALLGPLRTLFGVPASLLGHRPFRIDLPIPGIPIDVVLLSNPAHIKVLKQYPDAAGRLHDVPSKELPRWVQIYFSGTRFWDTGPADQWFVPMEGEDAAYPVRRGTIASLLAKGYSKDDVQTVASLLQAGAADDDLAAAMVNIVNSRFLNGTVIPKQVALDARGVFNNPPELLIPGKLPKARAASQAVVAFCAKTGPAPGLHNIDVAHNIGASANPLTGALKTLQANLDDDITAIFTRKENTPTPNVPRVALKASTFQGLLAYPSVPSKTVFIISISAAAGKTGSLDYTFGTGDAVRPCAFRPFFERFMGDLQQALRAGRSAE